MNRNSNMHLRNTYKASNLQELLKMRFCKQTSIRATRTWGIYCWFVCIAMLVHPCSTQHFGAKIDVPIFQGTSRNQEVTGCAIPHIMGWWVWKVPGSFLFPIIDCWFKNWGWLGKLAPVDQQYLARSDHIHRFPGDLQFSQFPGTNPHGEWSSSVTFATWLKRSVWLNIWYP